MRIDYPQSNQLSQLRGLWQEAFHDDGAFLDGFFDDVFSPDRCRCISVDGQVAAALYWLDCRAYDRPVAYLYAVATAKRHRGKGLCRALMEDTHLLLKELGYAGCLLVPEDHLVGMYENFGYHFCSAIREFSCRAGEDPISLRKLTPEEYAAARRQYLPEGGVVQEGENLLFLQKMTDFYAGEELLFCASVTDGECFCPELLGNAAAAPAVLCALGAEKGRFRAPGEGKDFAMFHALSGLTPPTYFGLAFD